MENFENLKIKLVRAINESSDRSLISKIWEMMNSENASMVSESPSIYETGKPMTEEEVEEYFKDEVVVLQPAALEMIAMGLDDVKNGRVYTEEEMEQMDDKWLN